MSCLTPEGALSGECDFLSANMYAKSLFGEIPPTVLPLRLYSTNYQVRMRWQISVWNERRLVLSLDMYGYGAKLRALRCPWVTGSPWVSPNSLPCPVLLLLLTLL